MGFTYLGSQANSTKKENVVKSRFQVKLLDIKSHLFRCHATSREGFSFRECPISHSYCLGRCNTIPLRAEETQYPLPSNTEAQCEDFRALQMCLLIQQIFHKHPTACQEPFKALGVLWGRKQTLSLRQIQGVSWNLPLYSKSLT